jgi:transcriptional regulator with XRE-family HTH domain
VVGFCHLEVSVPKPFPPDYPKELRTLGDHLRTARLDRGLLQKEVADMLGVEVNTVVGWEIGRAQPKVSYLPRIVSFIRYDPFPRGESLAEQLRVERQRQGLTQYQLAEQLGIYKHTITLVETGKEVTNRRALEVVRRFVEREGK